MADKEIIEKLTGLTVFDHFRIEGLQGEGRESVVLLATDLRNREKVVLKLEQSNPMFLLNEPDFDFLPFKTGHSDSTERFVSIAEKLFSACEKDHPGLFFWHIQSIYERLILTLSADFKQYNMAVMDTTTAVFQNDELIAKIRQTVTRKSQLTVLDLEYWEMYLDLKILNDISKFLEKRSFKYQLNFRRPTQLLALVFCEGFFGDIPTSSEVTQNASFLSNLTSDSPEAVPAESVLGQFVLSTDFTSIAPDVSQDLDVLTKTLEQLRGMLLEDATDRLSLLKGEGDRFLSRYNAGRNNLLRGLPRFSRTVRRTIDSKE